MAKSSTKKKPKTLGKAKTSPAPTIEKPDWLVEWEAKRKDATSRARKNKKAVLAALKKKGIREVIVTWDGSEDSGQIEEVYASKIDHYLDGHYTLEGAVEVAVEESSHNVKTGAWERTVKKKAVPLQEAVEQLVDDWLEGSHPGWETNAGAYGEAVFDVDKGAIRMTHNTRVEAVETAEETL